MARRVQGPVRTTVEMARVLGLGPVAPASVDDLHKSTAYTLKPLQAEALGALRALPGALAPFGSIPVGGGKSLIALLAATAKGCKRPLILTERALVRQMKRDLAMWSDHFHIIEPEIMSYGRVSRQASAHLMDELQPDIIVCDEAHGLKAHPVMSARTSRVMGYVLDNPETVFFPMSGSFADTSILDYYHLAEMALRELCPLPRDFDELDIWSAVIDPEREYTDSDRMSLSALMMWARTRNPCTAYRKRFRSAPGIVTSDASAFEGPHTIRALRIDMGPVIGGALETVSKDWALPCGGLLADASETARHSRTLSLGFYNRHTLIGSDPDILEWTEARKAWTGALGNAVKYGSQKGRDTFGLWTRAVEQGAASASMIRALARWKAIRHAVRPRSEVVWVDDRPLRAYLRSLPPDMLVWYSSKGVEALLVEEGFAVHGGGSLAPEAFVGRCAVSVNVHRKGWDGGQHLWSRQTFLEVSPSAKRWEQALGRLHRPGQESHVHTWINQSTAPLRRALDRAEYRSAWVANSHGEARKLATTTWGRAQFFDPVY